MDKPLVTISIPNYNYGHYLNQCLDSVLAQTYPNIEVHFSDNASTDDSFDIAYSYRKKFRERGIKMVLKENKTNVGSYRNSQLSSAGAWGKYIYTLASDDAIYPEFIERCVSVLEAFPNVGTVIVNRDEINERGEIKKLAPFYNESCIIDGDAQAGVYMLAGIAIPGQRINSRDVLSKVAAHMRSWNVAGDWYDNFLFACVSDVAYIKDSLMCYRVHSGNETNESERKLLGITEHYQLIHAFLDLANVFDLKKPQERYGDAVKHLGEMCPRYALRMMRDHQIDAARRYLKLALVFNEDMANNEDYKSLDAILKCDDDELITKKAESFRRQRNLNRTKSYDPPEGYQPLAFKKVNGELKPYLRTNKNARD